MQPALQIQNLTKSFDGLEVVKNIDLEISNGEIFGLLGPNGAGKSTTINMVTGVTRITSGKILVFGYDNQKDARLTRSIVGVVHQEIVTDPFFKVDQALRIHSGYFGVKDDPKWRELLVERLALGPHLKKNMNKLSGGMKRRLMVAKALIHKPKLIILDEPTAGVDVELRKTLWNFVHEINQKGTTVLLTTHHLEEAEQMCSRIAIMHHGKIIALDRTKTLMNKLNTKKILIRLQNRLENLPNSLSEFDTEILEDGKCLLLKIHASTPEGKIFEALSTSGNPILSVETSEARLEDVFLEMTGKTT